MREILETRRLRLRPVRMADAPVMARYTSDPRVARMLDNIPIPNPTVAVEGWLEIQAALRAQGGVNRLYGVEFAGDLAGTVGARWQGEAWSIGYWIGRPFWGQGLASEAARAVVDEAIASGPVTAWHYFDNYASGRVLEKIGFVYTGVDAPRFCLARGEMVEARQMRLQAQSMAA